MAFADITHPGQAVELLRRSLRCGRLGHAYLFTGDSLDMLETVARTLAKALLCEAPSSPAPPATPDDSCDRCPACRRVDSFNHPDVLWVRPESKIRAVTIDQARELIRTVNLKPAAGRWKAAIIVAADRMNVQAANAFLKTLEEPPQRSVLILLSTEPQRLLETIRSRCLRLALAPAASTLIHQVDRDWLAGFSAAAAGPQKSHLGRYLLLGRILARLAEIRGSAEADVSARSPLQSDSEADPDMREKWEDELAAAIEAEYRRRRSELLDALHLWTRDVWIASQSADHQLLQLPDVAENTASVARRVDPAAALENVRTIERTRRLLDSNVQEALALEVGLLKLRL